MKIKFAEKTVRYLVSFEDLAEGQTFFLNGFDTCWVKIMEVENPYDEDESFNAVCLNDGGLYNFNGIPVTPVEIEAEARFTKS